MKTEEREFGKLEDVKEFLEIGWPFKAVQELFGKSRNELNADIEAMGFTSYSDFRHKTIWQDYQKGMSIEAIAQKWARNTATMKKIIRKLKKENELRE